MASSSQSGGQPPVHGLVIDVVHRGGVGDGETDCTAAIQQAIDDCAARGGGTVLIPPGRFVVGTLVLCSDLTLHIERGAVLMGSSALAAYPETRPELRSSSDNYTCRSVLYAEQQRNLAITGGGTIDGCGAAFLGRPYLERPYLIRFVECDRIVVRDVVLRDSAMWVQHYLGCRDVTLDGLTIHSVVNRNNDGIDIDSSERVRISNCDITSEDDAIVLKATTGRPCRDITAVNCTLESDCNAFKIGTETAGDITDVTFANSTVRRSRLAGIAIETVDGGTVARVLVSGIVLRSSAGGIFVRLGGRGRPPEAVDITEHDPGSWTDRRPPGSMRDVVLSNVVADGVDAIGCSITGLSDAPIDDVTLHAVRIRLAGGGGATDEPAELTEEYPEYHMFGPLPAYGLYCRHVGRLTFDRLDIRSAAPDARPALACVDVASLAARDVVADISGGTELLKTTDVRHAQLNEVYGRGDDGTITAVVAVPDRQSEPLPDEG